ncbi:MAG: glutamate synthase central domain-containing protein, partial [Spirochaetota bacterium]
LRPSRYYVTTDDVVIMASEVGVLDIPVEKVKLKGRLQPGKMFLVDFSEGRIIDDAEIKAKFASERPYGEWLDAQEIHLSELKTDKEPHGYNGDTVMERMRAFGYTYEHCEMLLRPMAENSQEPLTSMGNDAALAVLSDKPRLIYDYFKQLFAQVTNPPIDSIREEIIMSLECFVGPEKNLLSSDEANCHRLLIPSPILTNEQLAALKHMNHRGWKTKTIDITFPVADGEKGLVCALEKISEEAEEAIAGGYSLILLSDRNMSRERVNVPALLAVGAVNHHLILSEKRTQIGIIVESGEPREVHHFCTLVGFGADAVNPYLAFEAMWYMSRNRVFTKVMSDGDIVAHYIKAMVKSMRKVMGKMGISTLESYKSAQIFEAIGLNTDVVGRCFSGTVSRIQGSGFDEIAKESLRRHDLGYPKGNPNVFDRFVSTGDYHVRSQGEKHMWEPEAIADMQRAVRYEDTAAWRRFADGQNARTQSQATLRGLLKIKAGAAPIPVEQVEPAGEIVKRFVTGAMSYGSISREAH